MDGYVSTRECEEHATPASNCLFDRKTEPSVYQILSELEIVDLISPYQPFRESFIQPCLLYCKYLLLGK